MVVRLAAPRPDGTFAPSGTLWGLRRTGKVCLVRSKRSGRGFKPRPAWEPLNNEKTEAYASCGNRRLGGHPTAGQTLGAIIPERLQTTREPSVITMCLPCRAILNPAFSSALTAR